MWLRIIPLIVLLGFSQYWFHIRTTPQDIQFYRQLLSESLALRARHALEEKPAHQKRSDVCKDIWTQNETHHFSIQSKDSDLTLWQVNQQLEATEELKQIICNTEENLVLSAEEGIYTFPSNQFIAQKNCHLLQNANQIHGTRIHLDLVQEIVTYENPQGALSSLQFQAKNLIWEKKTNQLHLTGEVRIENPDQFILAANLGTVHLDALEPTLIILEGNVRLISSSLNGKESYALADTLTYNPLQKTLLFAADKRVLFWQQGLSLSASEILVREDQTIEGHGDVHFSFSLDEQNSIEEIFRQYL